MFKAGDRIVHPMHGAGVVEDIVERRVAGVTRCYYVLHIPIGDMTVLIPTESVDNVGVRAVVDRETAEKVIAGIRNLETDSVQNWNQRYRDNMEKLRSGDLIEVSKVIKGLLVRDRVKTLSTGERRMLHSAKQILISELVLALGESSEEIDARLCEACVSG